MVSGQAADGILALLVMLDIEDVSVVERRFCNEAV